MEAAATLISWDQRGAHQGQNPAMSPSVEKRATSEKERSERASLAPSRETTSGLSFRPLKTHILLDYTTQTHIAKFS